LVAALINGTVAARAESLDEIYQKAKEEKTLALYAAGPTAPHERFAKEFQEKFPGVTVAITGGFSNVLNSRIEQQLKDKAVAVDLAFFQTVQDFVAWKQRGLLLNFKPDGFDAILPNFRDDDGAYVAVGAITMTYAYNTKLVKPEDAPKSALDFLKPQFAGKAISVYPADDDAALYLYHTIVRKYGWDWMDRYMANKPNFIQGHLPVARSIMSGANMVTFDATSSVWGIKAQGQPVEVVFSEVDPTPVFTVTAGIFKDAPHPNAAKLYISWYLAKEQQNRIGVFSPRTDVPPPRWRKPLTSYQLANNYREFITDAALVADLRRRFERYTGPPVNKGGVQ
jgi:ABC-type Fe3+ transport system substrate-binding protein